MWLLVALVGAFAASAAVDLSSGARAADDSGFDDGTPGAAGPTPDPDDDTAADESELIDHATETDPPTEPPEGNEDGAETDPWLEDGWTEDDDYVSTDIAASDEPDRMPYEPAPPPNESGAETDPWLDGWKDDDYVSTDAGMASAAPAAGPAIAPDDAAVLRAVTLAVAQRGLG